RYKLIYDIVQNVYELYDLEADPWEKKNLWPGRDQAGFATMKGYLDDWLERVYYARDPRSNQVMHKLDGILLGERPSPASPLSGASFDEGRIEVLGWDAGKGGLSPGDKAEVAIYFRAGDRPSGDYQVHVIARPGGEEAPRSPPAA